MRKRLNLKRQEAHKIHRLVATSNTGQTISARDITSAVRTVRVRDTGNRLTVKKVANPKVWSFQNPDHALAKAIHLAAPDKWSVVIHDDGGAIVKEISPTDFAKPLAGLRWRRFRSDRSRRQQQRGMVTQPA